jgi:hypothetical protein
MKAAESSRERAQVLTTEFIAQEIRPPPGMETAEPVWMVNSVRREPVGLPHQQRPSPRR